MGTQGKNFDKLRAALEIAVDKDEEKIKRIIEEWGMINDDDMAEIIQVYDEEEDYCPGNFTNIEHNGEKLLDEDECIKLFAAWKKLNKTPNGGGKLKRRRRRNSKRNKSKKGKSNRRRKRKTRRRSKKRS